MCGCGGGYGCGCGCHGIELKLAKESELSVRKLEPEII